MLNIIRLRFESSVSSVSMSYWLSTLLLLTRTVASNYIFTKSGDANKKIFSIFFRETENIVRKSAALLILCLLIDLVLPVD